MINRPIQESLISFSFLRLPSALSIGIQRYEENLLGDRCVCIHHNSTGIIHLTVVG